MGIEQPVLLLIEITGEDRIQIGESFS